MYAFAVLGLVFFRTKPRDWLGKTSPKSPIWCPVGCKTTTQVRSDICVQSLAVVQSSEHERSDAD